MHYIQPDNRKQISIITPTLDEMIPAEDGLRILDLIVTKIVTENPEQFQYKGQQSVGRRAYSPATMLKLYLYGYLNGISSSRRLEKETHRNMEVMWLLGNLRPDFKTIADYRRDNSDHLKFITHQFRLFLRDQGYIKTKCVAIDGTKIKANAKRRMLTVKGIEKQLAKADQKIEEYLRKLMENDRREDVEEELEGLSVDSTHRCLIDKIIVLQKEIEQLIEYQNQMEQRGTNYFSPTDPEATLVKSTDGTLPGYNVQTAVDSEYQMIVSSEVTVAPTDLGLLEEMVDSIKDEVGSAPSEVLADKGYCVPDQIERIEKNGDTTCYVPEPKTSRDRDEVTFRYSAEDDEYTCSEGKRLIFLQSKKKRKSMVAVYQGIECAGCSIRHKCTTAKKGRLLHRYHNQVWRNNYRDRMNRVSSKAKIRLRAALVEHPFGTIKCWMGKIPILLRGRRNVQTEINIYATAYNLRRLLNIESTTDLEELVVNYSWNAG